ncbi:MAG: hypothetical protein E6051_20090 [Citrobacter freundii]|uniref:hypothetical protein n=1 Tax=Citrobacter freundii TaxID=546 RepID=UPI0029119B37|nr:hypothetical protein [Citrobacter freundii]
MKVVTVTVEIEVPDTATSQDIREYVDVEYGQCNGMKADETRNIDDGLNGQLSRLATHSAEESAQMAKWDRPTPKSDLRLQAEKIVDDVQELIKRLPDADQGGA